MDAGRSSDQPNQPQAQPRTAVEKTGEHHRISSGNQQGRQRCLGAEEERRCKARSGTDRQSHASIVSRLGTRRCRSSMVAMLKRALSPAGAFAGCTAGCPARRR